jgi:hypothetical protein
MLLMKEKITFASQKSRTVKIKAKYDDAQAVFCRETLG